MNMQEEEERSADLKKMKKKDNRDPRESQIQPER